MTPDLALQKALRTRLVATAGVVALVPATSIIDVHARPAPDPSIILGETQAVDEGTSIARRLTRIYHTLHVWKREENLIGVKAICGAIRAAVQSKRLWLDPGFHCVDAYVSSTRYLRDPDGERSHGVVTVEALIEETGA